MTLTAPGAHAERADGGDGLGRLRARRGLHREHDLGGRRQGVVALGHRHLARVAGLALDPHHEPPRRGHRGDDAEIAQGAALGDVDLGVGAQPIERRLDPRQVG